MRRGPKCLCAAGLEVIAPQAWASLRSRQRAQRLPQRGVKFSFHQRPSRKRSVSRRAHEFFWAEIQVFLSAVGSQQGAMGLSQQSVRCRWAAESEALVQCCQQKIGCMPKRCDGGFSKALGVAWGAFEANRRVVGCPARRGSLLSSDCQISAWVLLRN